MWILILMFIVNDMSDEINENVKDEFCIFIIWFLLCMINWIMLRDCLVILK